MALLEDLADELSAAVAEAQKTVNDDTLVDQVAKVVGDTSSTLQEAFLTSMRIRTAARRGHETIEAIKAGQKLNVLDHPDIH